MKLSIFFKIAILTTFCLIGSESKKIEHIKLYERTHVDYPFCPDYYKYCTIIKLNIFNLQHLDVLDIDLGITDVRIKKTKTYGFNGTYLTEFKVTKMISRIPNFLITYLANGNVSFNLISIKFFF